MLDPSGTTQTDGNSGGESGCCGGSSFDPETQGCCNGLTYNLADQCCKGGKIKDLFKICIRANTGHAWIYAQNLFTKVEHTYGRWKKGVRSIGKVFIDGVKVDSELKYPKPDAESCMTVCNYKPVMTLGYDVVNDNCASYACSEWNRNGGTDFGSRGFFWGDTGYGFEFGWLIDSPETLIENINNPTVPDAFDDFDSGTF